MKIKDSKGYLSQISQLSDSIYIYILADYAIFCILYRPM
jgi:hypothetical protein